MGDLNERVLVLLSVVLVLLSFVSTYMVFTFVNSVPTTAPDEGSGVVAVNIVNPNTQAEPVKGSGIVALEIKPLD